MRLFESFATAMRQVAADTDAGRLTQWQEGATYDAVFRSYSGLYSHMYDIYLISKYQSLAAQYVLRFDNDYFAASGARGDESGPPWDLAAMVVAGPVHDEAIRSCFDRRAELKTNAAFWDCRATAERAFASAVHLRNMPLLEKLLSATQQAAADADAGKITADQMGGVAPALGRAYELILADAWRTWRIRQDASGTAP